MRLSIISPKDLVEPRGGDSVLTKQIYDLEIFSKSFDVIDRVMLSNRKESELPDGYFSIHKGSPSLIDSTMGFIRRYRHPIFTRFQNSETEELLLKLHSDVIFAEHLYMVPSSRLLNQIRQSSLIVASVHVIESRIQKGVLKLFSHSLMHSELKALSSVDIALVFNLEEKRWIELRKPKLKVICIKPFLPPNTKSNLTGDFLFVGNQSWAPNRECVEDIHEIWRVLNSQGLHYKINIVGTPPKVKYRDIPIGVTHHGFVDNLQHFYLQSSGFIAPIRTGGGVRVKLLEAITYGIPIVTTPSGLDDLSELSNFVNLGNKIPDFVSDVSDLGTNRQLRERQSEALCKVAQKLYDDSCKQWEELIVEILTMISVKKNKKL